MNGRKPLKTHARNRVEIGLGAGRRLKVTIGYLTVYVNHRPLLRSHPTVQDGFC